MRPNIGTELARMRSEALRAPAPGDRRPRRPGRLRAAIGRRLIGSGERWRPRRRMSAPIEVVAIALGARTGVRSTGPDPRAGHRPTLHDWTARGPWGEVPR